MQSNICFITLSVLVVVDMVFFSSVALQMFCCLLVCVVVGLVAYIAYKHHKGSYITTEQQNDYSGLISENISLTKELQNINQKRFASKQDLDTIATINTRLTHQIENLQIRLQELQVAKSK